MGVTDQRRQSEIQSQKGDFRFYILKVEGFFIMMKDRVCLCVQVANAEKFNNTKLLENTKNRRSHILLKYRRNNNTFCII